MGLGCAGVLLPQDLAANANGHRHGGLLARHASKAPLNAEALFDNQTGLLGCLKSFTLLGEGATESLSLRGLLANGGLLRTVETLTVLLGARGARHCEKGAAALRLGHPTALQAIT